MFTTAVTEPHWNYRLPSPGSKAPRAQGRWSSPPHCPRLGGLGTWTGCQCSVAWGAGRRLGWLRECVSRRGGKNGLASRLPGAPLQRAWNRPHLSGAGSGKNIGGAVPVISALLGGGGGGPRPLSHLHQDGSGASPKERQPRFRSCHSCGSGTGEAVSLESQPVCHLHSVPDLMGHVSKCHNP